MMALDDFAHPRSCLTAAAVAFYLILCRLLRFRRIKALHRKYGVRDRLDLARQTADQAQEILREMVELEFPKFMGFSIVFALFKTYGIPSISSLLVSTGELSSTESASKRTADTGVLILEFCLNPPSSSRSIDAVARMNYLHSRYKIANDDMLYTLSVFALEPVRWVNTYEWRRFTDLELCATGTFWKAMGDKMQINYKALPSHASGWQDGLQWLTEIREWSEAYEQQNMVPKKSNHKLASAHLEVILIDLPSIVRNAGSQIASTVLGERLRAAMMLESPPWIVPCVIEWSLLLRRHFLRHLALPRIWPKKYLSLDVQANSRYSSREWLSHPWYVRPTFSRRWGVKAMMARLLGRTLPGDHGLKFRPEGYLIPEIGPERFVAKGKEYMEEDVGRIRKRQPGECPFAIVKPKD